MERSPSFYDSGYHDGFTHGRIHGLIEGRALGRGKRLRDVGGNWVLWRVCIHLEGDPQTTVKGRRVGLILPWKQFVIWFIPFFLWQPIFPAHSNISLTFHALTHPFQMTLLPQLTYQDFYARFGLDTRHSAQLLAFIPDFIPLAKLLLMKYWEIRTCK